MSEQSISFYKGSSSITADIGGVVFDSTNHLIKVKTSSGYEVFSGVQSVNWNSSTQVLTFLDQTGSIVTIDLSGSGGGGGSSVTVVQTTGTSTTDVMSQNAVTEELETKVPLSGGTMEGALVAQTNTNYTTAQVRNVIISTGEPNGGNNGDIWIQYTAS